MLKCWRRYSILSIVAIPVVTSLAFGPGVVLPYLLLASLGLA